MEIKEPTVEELKVLVDKALVHLYRRDVDLIRRGVQEETLSHRLALYLEVLLCEHLHIELFDQTVYDVDTEYNKNGEDPKRLVPGGGGKRPDIIVHKRGRNDNNLLIIEVKKNINFQIGTSDDNKLRGATNPNHDFRYRLGLYLNLMSDCADLTWYRNGIQGAMIQWNWEGLAYGE
ncbi:hypothetical protein MTBBW1_2680003 [Desulfamplus magnetovallimortis]|uniref:Uncharacterized protein n=1 Tax=Desulfamplus magnetovallimortis TaxID=1246637 RepID=A0A1W1HF20_9BACT|nr:hypothetical protein [Desulfamplus magnetovallimortis]SLM31087.1 hypothetical protein MTBBW1_2680003 [Desulfamplus magnetovallimortis]